MAIDAGLAMRQDRPSKPRDAAREGFAKEQRQELAAKIMIAGALLIGAAIVAAVAGLR